MLIDCRKAIYRFVLNLTDLIWPVSAYPAARVREGWVRLVF